MVGWVLVKMRWRKYPFLACPVRRRHGFSELWTVPTEERRGFGGGACVICPLILDWFWEPWGRILLNSNRLDWSMDFKDLLEESVEFFSCTTWVAILLAITSIFSSELHTCNYLCWKMMCVLQLCVPWSRQAHAYNLCVYIHNYIHSKHE